MNWATGVYAHSLFAAGFKVTWSIPAAMAEIRVTDHALLCSPGVELWKEERATPRRGETMT